MSDAGSAEISASQLSDTLDPIANQVILDTHAQLEDVGHEVAPLNGPVHGLTNLGETIGLGHLGESGHLLTDLSGLAANPTDTDAVASLLSDTAHVTDATSSLVDAVTEVPAVGNGLVGNGSVLTPATDILNQAVLDFHTTLEDAGHEIPVLNAPVHAVTNLGETVGLGYLGEPGNLLTDLTTLPGSVLNGGGLASADTILTDVSHVLGSADTLVGSLAGATSAGGLLSSDGSLGPVTNLANVAVLDLHTTLEDIGHEVPLLNDTIHGLTNLGETLGLGHIGEGGNLLTDAAALPGDLLGGQGVGALSPILSDAGAVTNAAGGLLDGVIGVANGLGSGGAGTPVGGNLGPITSVVDGVLGGHSAGPLDGLLSGLTSDGGHATGSLLGAGAPLQPLADVANGLIDGVHGALEQAGHDVPVLNDPLHSVITLGNTAGLGELGDTSNLLTDVANLPGAVLSGDGAPAVTQVGNDVGHVASAAGGVLGSVVGILPAAGADGHGAGTPLDGALSTVTTVLGATNAGAAASPVGNLLGGLTGGTSGEAGAGTHPLIDLAAGPTTATPVAEAAVLTPLTDPAHAIQVSAVAVGADQPSLATATLLTGAADPTGGTTASGTGTETHPLIDLAAGSTTATPVAEATVLTPSADPPHAVQVSAIGVSGDQPSTVTASLLSNDGIVLPQTSGGADQLVGQALNSVSAAAPTSEAATSHDLHVDLGTVSIDPGSHTEVQHTDPTPHTATSSLHLLGL